MSRRSYPYISERKRLRIWPPCLICGEPSRVAVTVQTSWFRSDDEVEYLCERHQKAAVDELVVAWEKRSTKSDAQLSHPKHGGPHRPGHDRAKDEGAQEGQEGARE